MSRRKGCRVPGQVSLHGAAAELGMKAKVLRKLLESGEIPYRDTNGQISLDRHALDALLANAAAAADWVAVEERRSELDDRRRQLMTPGTASTDKQIRQRSGQDDHLELGIYKKPKRRRPVSPAR